MGTSLATILLMYLKLEALHCCIPSPPRPGGSENQIPTTQPNEIFTPTESAVKNETDQEKATTTIIIEHQNSHYDCIFEFSFSMDKGVSILPGATSKCQKSNKNNAIVSFLEWHAFQIISQNSIELSCSMAAIFVPKNGGIELVENAMQESINCSVKQGSCVTKDGPQFISKCSVPYIFDGRMYQACTDWPHEKAGKQTSSLWCATKTDQNMVMEDGQWGWCSSSCGYCGGKDISKNSTENQNPPSTPIPIMCQTEKGNPCIFPFLEGDQTHEECASWKGKYKWCATSVNADLSYKTWEKCDMATCEPTKKKASCKTISGPSTGEDCVFPFKDGGLTHSSCNLWKGEQWCATSLNSDGTFKTWGYCDEMTCPLGRKIRRMPSLTRSVDKCGYDCLINLKKKMASNPPKANEKLLAPTAVYLKEHLSNFSYNLVSDTIFQFVSGQNGIYLDCNIGHFSNFPNENRIFVKCSNDGLFTVTGSLSYKIWNDIDNTQFGCLPCPTGSQQILGSLEENTDNTIGIMNGIETFYECLELCADSEDECRVLQYSVENQMCMLYHTLQQTTNIDQGDIICYNQEDKSKHTKTWYPVTRRFPYALMHKNYEMNHYYSFFSNLHRIPLLTHIIIREVPKGTPWTKAKGFRQSPHLFAKEDLGDIIQAPLPNLAIPFDENIDNLDNNFLGSVLFRGHLFSSRFSLKYFRIKNFANQMYGVVPTYSTFEDKTKGVLFSLENEWFARGLLFMSVKGNVMFLTYASVPSGNTMKQFDTVSRTWVDTYVHIPNKVICSMVIKNAAGEIIYNDQLILNNSDEVKDVNYVLQVDGPIMDSIRQEWQGAKVDLYEHIPDKIKEEIEKNTRGFK